MNDTLLRIGRALKEHFNEMLLTCLLAGMLVFVTRMSAVHNDQLAASGKDYVGQILAALLAIMAAKKMGQNQP